MEQKNKIKKAILTVKLNKEENNSIERIHLIKLLITLNISEKVNEALKDELIIELKKELNFLY